VTSVLVAGGASGIGAAAVRGFRARGDAVVVADLDLERAQQVAAEELPGLAVALQCDLSTVDGPAAAVEAAVAHGGGLDVVFGNAGLLRAAPLAEWTVESWDLTMALNLRAPLLLTAGILRQHGLEAGGSLVFISSLSRFTAYPGAAVYAATKDGLAAYARSLALGLHRRTHVLTVYPGPTRTAHARRYSPDNRREARRMPPEQLASAIYRAVERRRTTVIPGLPNRAVALLGTLAPRLAEWLMRKAILDKLP